MILGEFAVSQLRGVGFSMRGLALARTKIRRLKPTLLIASYAASLRLADRTILGTIIRVPGARM